MGRVSAMQFARDDCLGVLRTSSAIYFYDVLVISVLILGGLASLAWAIFLGWFVAALAGVRVMSLGTAVDFVNQYGPVAGQYWPHAALAGSAGIFLVLFVLLRKIRKRVRSIEGQVSRLRTDMVQLQNIESRRLLDEVKSGPIAIIESNGASIVPEVVSSDQDHKNPQFPPARSHTASSLEET
jgi:hypothetical protein